MPSIINLIIAETPRMHILHRAASRAASLMPRKAPLCASCADRGAHEF